MTTDSGPQNQREHHFVLRAPAAAAKKAVAAVLRAPANCTAYLFELEPSGLPRVDGNAGDTPFVVPYPFATAALVDLMLDGTTYPDVPDALVDVFVSRQAFDRITEGRHCEPMVDLDLVAGSAAGDMTLANLRACLNPAVQTDEVGSSFVDQVVAALHAHLACRLGGIQDAAATDRGGLTPWQLRLARNAIDRHLDGDITLAQLAAECSLSISHFSRGFTRSTGLPPHRWLMRRRVAAAKIRMRSEHMSLAQIALACGFSDQSHFTRVFSTVTGMTPGRWREKLARGDLTPWQGGSSNNVRTRTVHDRNILCRSAEVLAV